MAVSKRTRYEVLRRDDHRCRYCGAAAPSVRIEVDHVVPRHRGGTDDPWNLTASCEACNAGKSASVPSDDVVIDVRRDEVAFRQSIGGEVFPCMYCSTPVEVNNEDGYRDDWVQCVTCNSAVCNAYEAGFRAALR